MAAARARGQILHSEGFEAILAVGGTSKRAAARLAGVSPSHLSDLLAHRGGAGPDVVDSLAAAVGVVPAALFPELVGWVAPTPDRDSRRGVA
jgi:DNA-binding transcriptional regulator YdaS (Cro superfamily)